MRLGSRVRLGQDVHAVVRLELFIVAAISAILVTRGYLALMNYPQIGGGGVHVAHVLWGGLLMLVSHVLLLGFLGPRVKELGAFVGGVGFGLFVDEVRKFVTADNDYFFRPAFAIIYVVFVGLVLVVHWLSEQPSRDPGTQLANAATIGAAGQLRGLDDLARTEARRLVDAGRAAGAGDREVAAVRELVDASPPAEGAGRYAALRAPVLRMVRAAARSRAAYVALIVLAVFALVDPVVDVLRALADESFGTLTTIQSIRLGWALLTAAFVAVGLVAWRRRGPRQGLRILRYAVLLNILVGQVFTFVAEELGAIPEVLVNLGALAVLNYRLALLDRTPAA